MAQDGESTSEGASAFRMGRRFGGLETADLSAGGQTVGATWRGWAIGFATVVLISLSIPYFDFVLRGTLFSNNMFPASAIFFMVLLLGLIGFTLSTFRTALGLTIQDLVLVFCMGMLVTALPGNGFWAFWVGQVTGGSFYDSPTDTFKQTVLTHVPPAWSPHDTETVRPVEWFYTGLPPEASIPWGPWVQPYLIWCAALLMIFGILFALSGLLRKQWSEREQLAFPLAQLPEDMLQGALGGEQKPFLKDRMALWGIGITLAFHSWNNLADYFPAVPKIPQGAQLTEYLIEPPWNGFLPLWTHIYPSVIGLTYLLPLEVSFSLWFYFLVQRLCAFVATRAGLMAGQAEYWNGPFVAQGTGACYALALAAFWMARRELGSSFKAAIGMAPAQTEPHEFHPRTLWGVLLFCTAGSLVWMTLSGIDFIWAVALLALMLIAMVGLSRLSCEGGLFFMQMSIFPSHVLNAAVTPHVLGASNYVKLEIWNRTMVADWFRVVFMPGIMNGLHLATRTGLTRRGVTVGMAAAVVLSLGVSFFSFLHTAYTNPGGAQQMTWRFTSHPVNEYRAMAGTVTKVGAYEAKMKEAEASGRPIPREEVPQVARVDSGRLGWMGFGAFFMIASLVLRTYVFWFPHPIGLAMWMGPYPNLCLWFSFLLGWGVKGAMLKYGGSRAYLSGKRFFIGIVVGEAIATVVWKLIAWGTLRIDGHNMLPG